MLKLISLGALAFSPLVIANQQAISNQNQRTSFPKIFDDVFESFFTAPDSMFDAKSFGGLNGWSLKNNQTAWTNFKATSIYSDWKYGFSTFLDNLNQATNRDLTLALDKVQNKAFYNEKRKANFQEYASTIKSFINSMPYGPTRTSIENQLQSLPFMSYFFKYNTSKLNFYEKFLDKILGSHSNLVPSQLMKKNLNSLQWEIKELINDKTHNHQKIEMSDIMDFINDPNASQKRLKDLFKKFTPTDYDKWEGVVDQLKNKIDDFDKYKNLLSEFDDILDKNFDLDNFDFNDIVSNISPDTIKSIVKNEAIFKKLGSNAPTMNSIQKGLTIAGGFGTLLISFFTAALALKLILVKSSKRAIALSSTGTITLLGTGVALIILAFI